MGPFLSDVFAPPFVLATNTRNKAKAILRVYQF